MPVTSGGLGRFVENDCDAAVVRRRAPTRRKAQPLLFPDASDGNAFGQSGTNR